MNSPNNGPQIDPRLRESLVRQDQNDDPIELPAHDENRNENSPSPFQRDRPSFPWLRTAVAFGGLAGLVWFATWGISQMEVGSTTNPKVSQSTPAPDSQFVPSPAASAPQTVPPTNSTPINSGVPSQPAAANSNSIQMHQLPRATAPTAAPTTSLTTVPSSQPHTKSVTAIQPVAKNIPSLKNPAPPVNGATSVKQPVSPPPPNDTRVRVAGVDVQKPVDRIRLAPRDNSGITRYLYGLTYSGDLERATTFLQDAMRMPDDLPPETILPEVTPELARRIAKHEVEFYQILIGDCCHEDGDIAEVLVNGQPYVTVPMTNKGASLSIPLQKRGGNSITVRGVKDGVGGITIYVRTSRGYHYCGMIEEGQELSLKVAL